MHIIGIAQQWSSPNFHQLRTWFIIHYQVMYDLHYNYNFKSIETTANFFSLPCNMSTKYEPSSATEHMVPAKKIEGVAGNCTQKETASNKTGVVK